MEKYIKGKPKFFLSAKKPPKIALAVVVCSAIVYFVARSTLSINPVDKYKKQICYLLGIKKATGISANIENK